MPESEQYIFTLRTAWHLGRRMKPLLSIMYDLLMVSTIIFTDWRLTAVSMLIVQYSITSPGQTMLSGVEVTSLLDQLSFVTDEFLIVLRDSLKRVKWDPRVVPHKTESVRFGRDSAKQANILRGRAARVIGS